MDVLFKVVIGRQCREHVHSLLFITKTEFDREARHGAVSQHQVGLRSEITFVLFVVLILFVRYALVHGSQLELRVSTVRAN